MSVFPGMSACIPLVCHLTRLCQKPGTFPASPYATTRRKMVRLPSFILDGPAPHETTLSSSSPEALRRHRHRPRRHHAEPASLFAGRPPAWGKLHRRRRCGRGWTSAPRELERSYREVEASNPTGGRCSSVSTDLVGLASFLSLQAVLLSSTLVSSCLRQSSLLI